MKQSAQLAYSESEYIGTARPEMLKEQATGGREMLAGVALLALFVGTDHFGFAVGGVRLRIELIAGGLLALFFVMRTRAAFLQRLGIIEYALVAWFAANLFSSLFFSPSPQDTLKNVAIIAGVLTMYALGLMLFNSAQVITWAALAWLAVGTAVALGGLVSAFLYTGLGWTGGVNLERAYRDGDFILTPRVQSTMWEPNIFGSYEVTVGILALALTLAPQFGTHRWQTWLRFAAGCAFCAVMLSMTRTVWLIAPLLLLVIVFLAWRLRLATLAQAAKQMLLPAAVGIVVGLVVGNFLIPTMRWHRGDPWNLTYEQVERVVPYLLRREEPPAEIENPQAVSVPTAVATPAVNGTVVASPDATPTQATVSAGSTLIDKLQEASSPGTTVSLQGRLKVFSQAIDGWTRRPIFGWGTGAYPLVYTPDESGNWVSNLELHLLFDTGVVGFILFGIAIVVAAVRGRRALLVPVSRWSITHFILLGLLVGGVGLLLSYQLTEATWMGFTWAFFALLVMAAHFSGQANRVQEERQAIHTSGDRIER